MWISPAYAQAAGGGADSGLVSLLPLVLIFVVFYFLLIRPQQKKMKAHKAMVEALRRGDRVVTAGGIIGTVSKVLNDNEVQLEIADGVRVRVVRSTIQDVLSRAEPADKSDKNKAGARKAAEEGKDAASGAKAANDSGGVGAASGGAIGKLSGLLGGRKRDS
ncbi:MAG: preprotein translocase subunit YajC [Alphaproteobacteria bacterium]|nr:MAG: preprotein translocase subunit YajC [Alphaproteobacteria bacterium]